jgi:hypothetical protein
MYVECKLYVIMYGTYIYHHHIWADYVLPSYSIHLAISLPIQSGNLDLVFFTNLTSIQ